MTHASIDRTSAPPRSSRIAPLQIAALVFGVAFLAVGVAGFIPGITPDVDEIQWAGHESPTELLGIFQVSVLHNVVHLLFGVVGLLAARQWMVARSYLITGGLVYLGLVVFGLIVDQDTDANFVPVNDADNWLHLGLGVGMIVAGALPGVRRR